jgi:hypothetical protein
VVLKDVLDFVAAFNVGRKKKIGKRGFNGEEEMRFGLELRRSSAKSVSLLWLLLVLFDPCFDSDGTFLSEYERLALLFILPVSDLNLRSVFNTKSRFPSRHYKLPNLSQDKCIFTS